MPDDVKGLQRALNQFTSSRKLRGVAPLRVDGDMGRSTRRRIHDAKAWLGYARSRQDPSAGDELRARLAHPNRWQAVAHGTRRQRKQAVRRGQRARLSQRRKWAANRARAAVAPGVGSYDGRPVARPFIQYMDWARHTGHDGVRWQGTLASGWRSPAYSESLCQRMCGAPSCPGRCAGRSSRHSQKTVAQGAVDVTDYARFGQLMAHCPIRPQIVNRLGVRDPVHFSVAGN